MDLTKHQRTQFCGHVMSLRVEDEIQRTVNLLLHEKCNKVG